MSWIAKLLAVWWTVTPVEPVVPDVAEAVADPEAVQAVETDQPAEGEASDEAEDKQRVCWIKIARPFREGPLPFAWLDTEDAGPQFADVIQAIASLGEGPNPADGLVLFLDNPQLPLHQSQALTRALREARDSGVAVYTFAESFDTWTYSIAAAGDGVWLQRKGGLMLQGLGMEELYLAETLDKVGVFADFVQIGRFKGADEQLTRTEPSAEWSSNIDALLDALYQNVIGGMAEDRGLAVPEFEELMAESWRLGDTELLEEGLVDRLVRRGLKEATADTFGDDFAWDSLMTSDRPRRATNPMALLMEVFSPPQNSVPAESVAVLHLRGPIMSGQSSGSNGLFSEDSIGSASVTDTLANLAKDSRVKAIVVRLDSPGGSAQASEVIWQAIDQTRESKPVVVSIGGMAASGGYYIASAADSILAEPTAILGSIGVVGGKLVTADLYDKIGLGVHQRTRGPNAAIFSSLTPFDDRERSLIQASMRRVYDQFLERIRSGRGDRLEDLDAVDEGMLFTGIQAAGLGMVDGTGGLEDAVRLAAIKAELIRDDDDAPLPAVFHLPRPKSLESFLTDTFSLSAGPIDLAGRGRSSRMSGAARAYLEVAQPLLGREAVLRLADLFGGLTLLQREPVLVLHPTVLRVR